MAQDEFYKDKLLVARPQLVQDKFFSKSVVYIYEQNDAAVLGVVLNKPSTIRIADLYVMRGEMHSGASGRVYKGGPVSDQSLLLLHTNEWESTNTMQCGSGLCLTSDELMLDKMVEGNKPRDFRMMAGMSTWAIPQLHSEIHRHNSWLVIEPTLDIFFNYDGEEQWKKAIEYAGNQVVSSFF